MIINFSFKEKTLVTDAVKIYIKQKFKVLKKIYSSIEKLQVNIFLVPTKISFIQKIEIKIYLDDKILKAIVIENNIYKSIDNIYILLKKQLMEYKENRRKKLQNKPMRIEEAIFQAQILGDDFFIFINSEIGKICAIYKKYNGRYDYITKE